MRHILEHLELLLLIAALVAMVARKLRIPYTVGLLVAGLALAMTADNSAIHLSKELIFTAFLPPLIFEASFFIKWKELKHDLIPTVTLATLGVLISAAISAFGMYSLMNWQWSIALLFGAMICATDPVSVIATFKDAGVQGRLKLLVESESILNDGTAAVLFGVVLAICTGGDFSGTSIAFDLVREVGGGAAIGLVIGAAILWIAEKTEDHLVEITLTTLAAYGSFLLAQNLHCSGVLSTLVCGLILGNLGPTGPISVHGREVINSFWEYVAFVANSLIFLLIGSQIARENLLLVIPTILVAYCVSTASRAAAVYFISFLFSGTSKRINLDHQHVLFWGGLRGALTLALALGLPHDLPYRSQLIAVVFGTVGLSIIAQGLSLPTLLRKLQLVEKG